MKTILRLICFLLIAGVFGSCTLFDPLSRHDRDLERDIPSLKLVHGENFLVGAAIEPHQLTGPEGALLRRHFSSLTPENAMKFLSIHPSPDEYNFERMDQIVAFTRRYGQELRGHTFVWHHPNEIADWMFFHEDGSRKSREEALALLEGHIQTLMERYGGDVSAWDVVNEAIDTNEPDNMRRTPWYETIGPDYVARAFEIAHRANPEAKLFYNDYMTFDPQKTRAIVDLVRGIQAEGIPVHGIGMQLHITLVYPEIEAIEFAILQFKQLVDEIHITELDMSLYTQEFEVLEEAPEDYLIRQAHRYRELFEVLEAHKNAVTSVTFWGFTDGHTWLTGEPYNRSDWPLLFDDELRAKLAFHGVTRGQLPPDVEVVQIAPPKTYVAKRGTPTIDGEIDEIWNSAEIVSTEIQVMAQRGAVGHVRVLWDEDHLYFLAEVTDSLLNADAGQRHEHDSFEVFVDENNGKTPAFEGDDYQYRVNFRNQPSWGGAARMQMMTHAAHPTDEGYIVELQVELNTITASPGSKLGIEFQINDADDSATRVAISKWNDPTNESWRNTSGWGILEMVE